MTDDTKKPEGSDSLSQIQFRPGLAESSFEALEDFVRDIQDEDNPALAFMSVAVLSDGSLRECIQWAPNSRFSYTLMLGAVQRAIGDLLRDDNFLDEDDEGD